MNFNSLIDIHTHFFPDNIAKDTILNLTKKSAVIHYGFGTQNDLLKFMSKDSVSISVNQPVATRIDQVHKINCKMVEFNKMSKKIMCFGSIHPVLTNFEEEIIFLKENGIKGFKIHPEYQNFYPDDDKYTKFYEVCVKYDMIILSHCGYDFAFKKVHSTPKRFAEVLKIKGLKLILAHMGGYKMWDDVGKYLVGKEVYFDTAYTKELEDRLYKQLILTHSEDKILFGTDFPWERASVIKQKIMKLEISEKLKENILFKNAKKLLNI